MKKYIFFLIVILCSNLLHTTLIEVCLSGDKDFTSIQDAVNAAPFRGAIIQVYPGTYHGTIRIREKSLTLQSLYATTQDTTYIHNTRLISKVPDWVIRIGSEDSWDFVFNTVVIDGFTISNNLEGVEYHLGPIAGSGIRLAGSNATIKNNIITKNFSRVFGAGIFLDTSVNYPRTVYLENNQIFNNKALASGGGVYAGNGITVIFSDVNRNSIYENRAAFGQDIALYALRNDVDIYLDKGSRIITEVDDFYVWQTQYLLSQFNITFNIQQETLPPFVNSDLYVSPWGNDNNLGTNPNSPLKTVHYAASIIASDSINPKTIYLAPGIYSPQTGYGFPFRIPYNVSLIGSGIDETIFEEFYELGIFFLGGDNNIKIGGFTFRNTGNPDATSGQAMGVKNALLFDVLFTNNKTRQNIIVSQNSHYITIKNLIINNSIRSPLAANRISNVKIENLIINNMNDTAVGITLVIDRVPDILVNNLSYTNSYSNEHSTVFRSQINPNPPPSKPGTAIYNNVLIANNNTFDETGFANWGVVRISRTHSETFLNNWTIANNYGSGNTEVLVFGGSGATVNNMILHNPDKLNEIYIDKYFGTLTQVTINNSIIRDNLIHVEPGQPAPILNNVIFDDPNFLGKFNEKLTPSMLDYYYLHESSPAIDTGIDVSHMMDLDVDLAGNPRIYGSSIDMGAFEYQGISVNFTAEPRSGYAPLSVQFLCLSSEPVYSWEWDFNNDGIIDSTEQNPVFVFTENGKYSVTLTINDGEQSITKTDFITAGQVNEEDETIPAIVGFNLQNYPNPVNLNRNPNTIISFDTLEKAQTEPVIEIFNIRGQKIRVLNTGISFYDLAVIAGLAQENLDLIRTRNYSVIWDMKDQNNREVTTGVYFYRAVINGKSVATNRMTVIK